MFCLSRMRSGSDAIYLRQGSLLLENPARACLCRNCLVGILSRVPRDRFIFKYYCHSLSKKARNYTADTSGCLFGWMVKHVLLKPIHFDSRQPRNSPWPTCIETSFSAWLETFRWSRHIISRLHCVTSQFRFLPNSGKNKRQQMNENIARLRIRSILNKESFSFSVL